MRNTELYFAQKFCWDHKIFIVVKPVNNHGKYRLAISRSGKEKLGEEIYENSGRFKWQITEDKDGVQKKTKVFVPSVHDKIKELYVELFRKNNKPPEVNPESDKTEINN